MEVKEKKLVAMRMPHKIHVSWNGYKKRWLAMKLANGYTGNPGYSWFSCFSNRKELEKQRWTSQILPWLYIGQLDSAQNKDKLIHEGFTHIINATAEVLIPSLLPHYPLSCTRRLTICFQLNFCI